jgi:hypothetical protein
MISIVLIKAGLKGLPEYQLQDLRDSIDVELKRRESVLEQVRRF